MNEEEKKKRILRISNQQDKKTKCIARRKIS